MQDWQQRVVEESEELAIKLTALDSFIEETTQFEELNYKEQGRLYKQQAFMRAYLEVLLERIGAFDE